MLVKRLKEHERAAHFRWGNYRGIIGPGWHVEIPLSDMIKVVDLHEAIPELTNTEIDEGEIRQIVRHLVLMYHTTPSNVSLRAVREDMVLSSKGVERPGLL